ncbi:hypothetical protein, partial [Yersinia enterocolitica]|uniref:hypothetical protein n=1 Tax=Yersinia enterocolitica TaxID=630 RepID=UPI001E465A4C
QELPGSFGTSHHYFCKKRGFSIKNGLIMAGNTHGFALYNFGQTETISVRGFFEKDFYKVDVIVVG